MLSPGWQVRMTPSACLPRWDRVGNNGVPSNSWRLALSSAALRKSELKKNLSCLILKPFVWNDAPHWV